MFEMPDFFGELGSKNMNTQPKQAIHTESILFLLFQIDHGLSWMPYSFNEKKSILYDLIIQIVVLIKLDVL